MKFIPLILLTLVLACNAKGQGAFKVGSTVEVNVSAHWYKAQILQVNGDKYKVHYDGYPASDDGWVHFTQIRLYGKDAASSTSSCNWGPPPGTFSNSSPASQELFKYEVYEYYARTLNGTITRPVKAGISFLSYNAKTSYKNTVSTKPGVGAVRRHDGAPVNGTIYPVRIGYIVCKMYGEDEVERTEVYADFSFFKNRDGEWTCSKDN